MTQRYPVKKDLSFGIFLPISCLIITGVAFGLPLLLNEAFSVREFLIVSIFVILVIGLILWCWYGTFYLIENGILIARCGPFTWKIPVREITTIRLNQKTIGGIWKPSLSWNSIQIQYGKYQSINITPVKQDDFLNELQKINDKIEIKHT